MVTLNKEIGYVENFIGEDKVAVWFYRKHLGKWRIALREKLTLRQKEAKFESDMIGMISKAVPALRNYWRRKVYGMEPAEPKGRVVPFEKGVKKEVGRNDPCPCGSGKKNK